MPIVTILLMGIGGYSINGHCVYSINGYCVYSINVYCAYSINDYWWLLY